MGESSNRICTKFPPGLIYVACEMQTFKKDTQCAEIAIQIYYYVKSFTHVQPVIDTVAIFAQNVLL